MSLGMIKTGSSFTDLPIPEKNFVDRVLVCIFQSIINQGSIVSKHGLMLGIIILACVSCGGGSKSQSPSSQEQIESATNVNQQPVSASEFDTDGDGTPDYKDPFPENSEYTVSKAVPEAIELLR